MTEGYLRLLSKEDLQKVHNTSLEILENIGMLIDHDQARQMLQEAGAKIDHGNKIVKFPPSLVEESLKSTPRTLTYAGRDLENDVLLKVNGDCYGRTTSGETQYVDVRTRKCRRARIADLKEVAVLVDALPNIKGCGQMFAEDVPAQTADIHAIQVLLENQRKHIFCLALSVKNLMYIYEMMLAVRGSREEMKKRPLLHSYFAIISPLSIPEDDINMLFLAGKYGIPIAPAVMPSAGTTGPLTLAGTFAQGNAEVLAAITLAQVAHPGSPISYQWFPVVTDMSRGLVLEGSPENVLLLAAMGQMGREFYGMPGDMGPLCTDGPIWEQAMAQKTFGALMGCLGGLNFVAGAGGIDTAITRDPVQLVMDDEIVAIARRICRGFEVNDDTLGLDAIYRVGPRGNFLSDKHTMKYLRTDEFFRPTIFNYDNRHTWYAEGAKSLEQRAKEKALTILKEYEVESLDKDVVKEIRSIVSKADKELAK